MPQYLNNMETPRRTPVSTEECLTENESVYVTIFKMAQDARSIQRSRTREAKKIVEDFDDPTMVPKYKSDVCCSAMELRIK